MIQRCVYRMQCKENADEGLVSLFKGSIDKLKGYTDKGELMTLSVFRNGLDFFVYYECTDRVINPFELFGDLSRWTEKWPGEKELRCWVPMMDIYHCCEPVNAGYWKRTQPVKRAYATINKLRPEMVASYIFYHFQYQEEKPGDWAKYAAIYLHENFMFFYLEEPDGPSVTPYKGKLDTANTPGDWQTLMYKHFLPWEDDPEQKRPWREIETVLYL